MNRPCSKAETCPGSDNPLGNFSSEAPDLITFREVAYPIFNPNNPIGGTGGNPPIWFADACDTLCVSFISQEDANLCAARAAFICAHTPPVGPRPQFFYNTPQFCELACGNGSFFFWTVNAGEFVGLSQSAADQQAQAYACEQAALHAFCLNDIDNQGQIGVLYDQTIFVQGADRPPVLFTVVSGQIPPGLGLGLESGLSADLSGKPTQSGTYTFTVQATDAFGIYVQKTYTITVEGPPCVQALNTFNWIPNNNSQLGGAAASSYSNGMVVLQTSVISNAGLSFGQAEQDGFLNPTANEITCKATVTIVASSGSNSASFSIQVVDQTTGHYYLQLIQTGRSNITNGVYPFDVPAGANLLISCNLQQTDSDGGAGTPGAITMQIQFG